METNKRGRVSNGSVEDTDVIESDSVDRDNGVANQPKKKLKKTKKKNKSSSPSNSPSAGTSKSSGDASCSAQKPSEEENNEDDKCPICLCEFGPEVAFPDSCEHKFCSGCILKWAKKVNTCPIDRSVFKYVLILNRDSSEPCERIEVGGRLPKMQPGNLNPATTCLICGLDENLLTCCECYRGFHSACLTLTVALDPTTEPWRCPYCVFQETYVRLSENESVENRPINQPRVQQYQRAQEYFQRLNRMYQFNENSPLGSIGTFLRSASPPLPFMPVDPSPRSDLPPTGLNRDSFYLSPGASSSDESDEATNGTNLALHYFQNTLRPPLFAPPGASTTSSISSSDEEEDTVAESSGSLLNPIHVPSDSSDDESNDPHAMDNSNEDSSISQRQRPPPSVLNRSADAPFMPVMLNSLSLRNMVPMMPTMSSGHGSNSSHRPDDLIENPYRNLGQSRLSAVPNLFAGRETFTFYPRGPTRQAENLSSPMRPRRPPEADPETEEDIHIIEEHGRPTPSAIHNGHGNNNNNLVEDLRRICRRETRPSIVPRLPTGRNFLSLFNGNLMGQNENLPAPIQPQVSTTITSDPFSRIGIALLAGYPTSITQPWSRSTNQIDTVPENSSSSIQRSPAGPTTRQQLVLPKLSFSSSNSFTTNGS